MALNRRFLYWGIFFIVAGAVLLVAQSTAVSDDDVAAAWQLWPIAVIALGAGLLLRRTRFDVAGGMLAAAMPGLLLGGVLVTAPRLPADCGDVRPVSLVTRQGAFDGDARVELRLACGDVTVTTGPGSNWQIQTGSGTTSAPVIRADGDRLSVESSAQRHPFGFAIGDSWRLSLPVDNRLDLSAEISAGKGDFDLAGARLGSARLVVNAGDAHVNLADASLDRLSLRVNAAAATLTLPAAEDLVADLSVNAGAVKVCAPSDLGLRVREDGTLAGFTPAGLVLREGAWESPNYATAAHHADVSVTTNVGSVDINPEGGCQ